MEESIVGQIINFRGLVYSPINEQGKDHENWGIIRIKTEKDLSVAIDAIKRSHTIIKKAIQDNINTGWYAVTPKEKLTWAKGSKAGEESEDE